MVEGLQMSWIVWPVIPDKNLPEVKLAVAGNISLQSSRPVKVGGLVVCCAAGPCSLGSGGPNSRATAHEVPAHDVGGQLHVCQA